MDASTIWWLSYVDEWRDVSRGVVVVRAASFFGAVARARKLGISPGGQVRGWVAPAEHEAELEPYVDRFIPEEEARVLAKL